MKFNHEGNDLYMPSMLITTYEEYVVQKLDNEETSKQESIFELNLN